MSSRAFAQLSGGADQGKVPRRFAPALVQCVGQLAGAVDRDCLVELGEGNEQLCLKVVQCRAYILAKILSRQVGCLPCA
ncbi:hypothetical protein, partial [Pseudomonas sp. Kh7]|uniref:hypothetical protein n=1 Tax=Pseudomonas sp. Kh7 TaxID=2093743 RepID=UPI0011847D38